MDQIKIGLTDGQCKLLKPLFRQIKEMFWNEKPGIICAQIWENNDGTGYFDARIIDNEQAKIVVKTTGGSEKISKEPRGVEYFIPE